MIEQMEMVFIEDEGDVAEIVNYLPPGLRGFMGSLDMAEPLIAEYQRRYPARAELLFDAYKTIAPTSGMWNAHPTLVEHHMRELLQRVADGEDVHPATAAEMCIGFSSMAHIAPMRSGAAAAYQALFIQIFGELPQNRVALHEPYPGSNRDLIRELRDDLAIKDRYVPGSVPRV